MSILALALSQKANRRNKDHLIVKYILENYGKFPTHNQLKKDPFFLYYQSDKEKPSKEPKSRLKKIKDFICTECLLYIRRTL